MYQRLMKNLRLVVRRADFWIAVAAGIVYSSWPLGFLLNPLVAQRDFASQLEAAHQPYNWVFITLDVASGVLLCWLGFRQWRKTRRQPSLRLSVLAYVLFGLFVIMAAVAPDNCATERQCNAAVLSSPIVAIHGFASIVSVALLLASLLLTLPLLLARRYYRWAALLAVFVLTAWGLTGVGTLVVMAHNMRDNWLQYNLISVCSLSVIICAALIERLATHRPALQRVRISRR